MKSFLRQICLIPALLSIVHCTRDAKPWQVHGALGTSANGHYIAHRDGHPFLWLGDTGWALFQRLTREQADLYLDNRAEKGFTVIQAVAFWYPHGGAESLGPHNAANVYGHRPFKGGPDSPSTAEPLVVEGGTPEDPNDYWDHVDYVIRAVKSRGLYLALLPCWGNAYINNRIKGSRIEFTADEARAYGRFLGRRCRLEPHIIWVLGGDVDPVNFGERDQRQVYRAMAEGIGGGVSGNSALRWDQGHPDWDASLMTFHAVQAPKQSGARGGSSSIWFHSDAWLDANMMETFQWIDSIIPLISRDHGLKEPVKPTILGEGAYEDGKYNHECGWITALEVRRQAFYTFFAGGAGHTYGHWAIWPFRGTSCGVTWDQALDAPVAHDIAAVFKAFLIDHHWHSFYPDPSLILSSRSAGETTPCAVRQEPGGGILVYFPDVQPITLDLPPTAADGKRKLAWYDPRNGARLEIESGPSNTFTPPAHWEDAVLVIE